MPALHQSVSKQCTSNDTVHQKQSQSVPPVVLYHMCNFNYIFAFLVLLTGLECMFLQHVHTDMVTDHGWKNLGIFEKSF